MKAEQTDTASRASGGASRALAWLHPRRPWLWLVLILVLYALLGFLLVPRLLERQLVSLAQERLALDASVGEIAVNPFTFTLRVDGLALDDPAADGGTPLLAFDLLFVNFQTSSLFRRAWTFAELHLDGLHARIERYADGSTNLARLGDRWDRTAPPDEEEPREPEPESDEGPLRLIVADLRLRDGAVLLRDDVPETPFETRLGPLDLTVADLSTLPEVSGDQAVVIRTEEGAEVRWTGDLELAPLRSQGRLTVTGEPLGLVHRYLRDRLAFDLEPGTLDLGFDYALELGGEQGPRASVSDLSLELRDLAVLDPQREEPVFELPSLTVSGGSVAWPEARAALGEVVFSGARLRAHRDSAGDVNLLRLAAVGDGSEAGDASTEVPVTEDPVTEDPVTPGNAADQAPDWRLELAKLRFEQGRVDWTDEVPGEPARLTVDGIEVTVTDLVNAPGQRATLEADMRIAENGALAVTGDLALVPEFDLRAEVTLDGLPLTPAQPYLAEFVRVILDDGRLALRGELRVGDDEPFGFAGDVDVADLALRDQERDEPLLAWDALQFEQLRWSTAARALEIADVTFAAPYARIAIAADGSSNVSDLVVESGPDESDAEAPASQEADGDDAAATPLRYALGQLQIAGARMDFSDESLPFPFAAQIAGLEGTVSALASDTREPARVELEGQVDEYGLVRIDGALRPAALEEYTQLDLTFRNLDMPALSPYVIRFAGREVDEGRLDVDLSYRIEDSRVIGDNRVVMRQFELGDRVEHPDAANLPLGLAVALLKDGDGVIDVEVPVSGDLGDPEFDYGAVVRRALTNLITGIVSSPFRFLANLVGADEETFDEIRFRPGRADLLPPELEKLGKLAEALAQRPELEVAVPALLARTADSHALRTAQVDARIDARLGAARDSESAGAVAQQRLEVLESLAGEAGLDAAFEDLRATHTTAGEDDGGLDVGAYNAALRERLIEKASVADETLQALARERAERVSLALRRDGLVTTERVRIEPLQEVEVNEEDNLVMSLEVTVGD